MSISWSDITESLGVSTSRPLSLLRSAEILGRHLPGSLGLCIQLTWCLSQIQAAYLYRAESQANNCPQPAMGEEDEITIANLDKSEFIILVFRSFLHPQILALTFISQSYFLLYCS